MTDLMFVIANEPHRPIASLRARLPEEASSIVDMALAKVQVGRRDAAVMAHAMLAAAGSA